MNQGMLAKKMVSAMKQIDAVAKSGYNQKQGYNYVQAADVAHEVRKAFIDNGIAFDYDVVDTVRWDRATSSGGSMACVQVTVAVTFTDQDSGEFRTVKSIGWGMDSLDKAPYKAMTGALKYALRMNCLIPDNADPENDSGDKPPIQQDTQRAAKPAPTLNQQLRASLNPDAEDPNDYDVHMDQSERHPPQPSVGPAINPKLTKVLYAIAMGKWNDTKAYRSFINKLGYSKDTDIPQARFEEIKAKLEAA